MKEQNKENLEMNKMRADMKHDLAAEYHWEQQRKHWDSTVRLAVFAIVITPFLTSIIKHFFS